MLTLLNHGAMALLKQVFSSSNTFELLILQRQFRTESHALIVLVINIIT